MSSVDATHNQADTHSRVFGRTVGKETFRPGLAFQNQFRLKKTGSSNEMENIPEHRLSTLFQRRINPEGGRMFGLRSRITEEPLHFQENNISEISDSQNHRMSTFSRTFGLIPEDMNGMNSQNNGRTNQEFRSSSYSSSFQRPFELDNGRINQNYLNRGSFSKTTTITKTSETGGGGDERFQSLQRNLNSSKFELQPRNLSIHSNLYPERSFRLNQDVSHNISSFSKSFGLGARGSSFERKRYNEHLTDDNGFKIPRMIRGRNSTLSSRYLQNQRNFKDLSFLSGFNSFRDTSIDSRLLVNGKLNRLDNLSIASSSVNVAAVRSHFKEVFDNLSFAVAKYNSSQEVLVEIEKAKQMLEVVLDRSLPPSVKDSCEMSVISHSSRNICPTVGESSCVLDGGSLHLKSATDLLKTLSTNKDKFESFTCTEEKEIRRKKPPVNSDTSDNSDSSELTFKKPKPYVKKVSRSTKKKPVQKPKKLTTETTDNVINLHQWYPVASGSELSLCGFDDKGAVVKTQPIKKRLNNRTVELVNHSNCNLIGSPSKMVLELPRKITAMLKNGLTDRWRVLQKELLNCQTAEEMNKMVLRSPRLKKTPEKSKTTKKSPKGKKTPEKNTIKKSPKPKKTSEDNKTTKKSPKPKETPENNEKTKKSPKVKKTQEKKIKVVSVPVGKSSKSKRLSKISDSLSLEEKKTKKISKRKPQKKNFEVEKTTEKTGTGMLTRSGRVVKAPSMFWLATGEKLETSRMETPMIKVSKSTKKLNKTSEMQPERKRKITKEDSLVESKKSKMEKNTKVQVEVRVKLGEEPTQNSKKSKSPITCTPKRKKSPMKKNKKVGKKKTTKVTVESEKKNEEEMESEDFELSLDDIHVPEVAPLNEDPKLSRSQIRLAAMETPPLKYFNSNFKLLKNITPVNSPNWYTSQRTESEARIFQKRREQVSKHTKVIDVKKTIIEKHERGQSRDLKRMIEWVADKTVRTPECKSKILQYVLPSRKNMELDDEDEEDEEEL